MGIVSILKGNVGEDESKIDATLANDLMVELVKISRRDAVPSVIFRNSSALTANAFDQQPTVRVSLGPDRLEIKWVKERRGEELWQCPVVVTCVMSVYITADMVDAARAWSSTFERLIEQEVG